MAKPAKPAAAKKEDAPGAEAAAPKSKKKLIIIVAAVVLLAGAGAGWFFTRDKPAHTETTKTETAKEPKFIPLEAFTVNLQHEESDQYLQISITLKVMEPELEDKIKAVLPEIRSKLNLLLSSKRPSELATIAGKKKLAIDIATEANSVLGIHNAPEPVAAPVASGVAVASVEGASAVAPVEAASSPEPAAPDSAAHAETAEKKGVVDVLFTSFIIQ
jgi:flagellar FliL protein